MRDRASAVLLDGDKIALIKRTWKGETYFVFPGGGIEEWETPAQAAEREVFEELGLVVKVQDCLYQEQYEGHQFFFGAEILSGQFGSGKGEEFIDPERNRGKYEPVWLPIREMPHKDVRPQLAAVTIQKLILASHSKSHER
ncbi:NUDIX hydrolase [Planococcus sp. FY231025]|uniref:NUDIX hydrolase n=1 Tax=Planococcus sp. FY231025 TaxID=3455699 RepID=UPI003F92839F